MIRRAIERPVSTLLGALTVVVLGVFSLLRLPVALLPALERPGLEITATAPGSGRVEVLARITRPLEQRLAAIPGVTSVRSSTDDGRTQVRVESEWQTDPDRLRIEAERRLAGLDVPGMTLAVELVAGDTEPIVEVAGFSIGQKPMDRRAVREPPVPPSPARCWPPSWRASRGPAGSSCSASPPSTPSSVQAPPPSPPVGSPPRT